MTKTKSQEPVQNPFQQLIIACDDDPSLIQREYELHRSRRNVQSKAKILDREFSGWYIDEILKKLIKNEGNDGDHFVDPRNNVGFWARPPQHIRELVGEIQNEIRKVAPALWFTPLDCLHLTTLEIANSRTPFEVEKIVSSLEKGGTIPDIVNYTLDHRARLINPTVSYDATAMALSFVPAAKKGIAGAPGNEYTYHHLRRDLFDKVTASGVNIAARYTVPSAHITIARFVSQDGFSLGDPSQGRNDLDHGRVLALIEKIEEINQTLKHNYWPREDPSVPSAGEWVVGQEQGLDFCKGTSWYGKSDRILLGQGF
ncbi:hypothetical protein MAP00_008082 [Monascus purpureus]|nr:hypothetical protein MAP00_008082 [Monascus purpureus]